MFLVIGHRGNCPRVLKWYLRLGVPVIEVDARFSGKDFIVLHGPSPIRRASVFGKAMAWIDYHFFYRDPLFKPYRLEDVLRIVSGRAGIDIDVKQLGFEEELLDIVRDTGFRGKIYVSSEIHSVIRRVKEIDRSVETIASLNIMPVNPLKIISDSLADIASIHIGLIDKGIVREIHSIGVKVIAWTVNDTETMEKLLEIGVDGIVTDRPDKALKLLKTRNPYNPA